MGIVDIIIAGAILGFAAWLLYRSLWKKKGHCHGCDTGCCGNPQQGRSEEGKC